MADVVLSGLIAWSFYSQAASEDKQISATPFFSHTLVLNILWRAQIPGLTERVADQDGADRGGADTADADKAWKVAIRDLKEKHRLLTIHSERTGLLDCHPLIRQYFGQQLKTHYPQAWQQAHYRLYQYYKRLPGGKALPDTLEEMRPLFSAITHACAAGEYQTALDEIYLPRIQRENYYSTDILAAYSDDLACLSHFFSKPWQLVAGQLDRKTQSLVFNWVGFRLHALARLSEAIDPLQQAQANFAALSEWKKAVSTASELSVVQLSLGQIDAAIISGKLSVDYAKQSGSLFRIMASLSTQADALLQAGELEQAHLLLVASEQVQAHREAQQPWLFSISSFRYCELLLNLGDANTVLARANYALKIAQEKGWPLGSALDQLNQGRAYLQLK